MIFYGHDSRDGTMRGRVVFEDGEYAAKLARTETAREKDRAKDSRKRERRKARHRA